MSDKELTPDQVAWLRERAEVTRKRWAEHARSMTEAERQRMEEATRQVDAEAKAILAERELEELYRNSTPLPRS